MIRFTLNTPYGVRHTSKLCPETRASPWRLSWRSAQNGSEHGTRRLHARLTRYDAYRCRPKHWATNSYHRSVGECVYVCRMGRRKFTVPRALLSAFVTGWSRQRDADLILAHRVALGCGTRSISTSWTSSKRNKRDMLKVSLPAWRLLPRCCHGSDSTDNVSHRKKCSLLDSPVQPQCHYACCSPSHPTRQPFSRKARVFNHLERFRLAKNARECCLRQKAGLASSISHLYSVRPIGPQDQPITER